MTTPAASRIDAYSRCVRDDRKPRCDSPTTDEAIYTINWIAA